MTVRTVSDRPPEPSPLGPFRQPTAINEWRTPTRNRQHVICPHTRTPAAHRPRLSRDSGRRCLRAGPVGLHVGSGERRSDEDSFRRQRAAFGVARRLRLEPSIDEYLCARAQEHDGGFGWRVQREDVAFRREVSGRIRAQGYGRATLQKERATVSDASRRLSVHDPRPVGAIRYIPPQLPVPSFARPIAVKRTIPATMRTSWTDTTISTIRQTRLGRAGASADSGAVAIASLTW